MYSFWTSNEKGCLGVLETLVWIENYLMQSTVAKKSLAIPILTVPSCLSSYVLNMTCCICILSFRRDRAILLRRAAPSRSEIWLKMRIRVRGEASLNLLTCGSLLWIRDYPYLCISETDSANHCAAFCTLNSLWAPSMNQ